jgi:DNA-directed RNA polymerase subunit H
MEEFPAIVIKTRALLTMRDYVVDELFEYANRYAMYPIKGSGADATRAVTWILKESKVVGVAMVRDVAREMEERNAQDGMLVGGLRFTPAAKKSARTARVELIEGTYASFEIFKHELVSKHSIVNADEIQLVLSHYGIEKNQLPRILRDDPAAKALGAKPGEVVRIERDSAAAGIVYYYRLVVDSS